MNGSNLAEVIIPAHENNYYHSRSGPIKKMIVHHVGGVATIEALLNLFARADRGASATYGIGNDGRIGQGVDEAYAPGTSGSYMADGDAITVEVSNCEAGGEWRVSDSAIKSLIMLCADVAKRHKFGRLIPGVNLCWHSMYAATTCPGPYLLSMMDHIAYRANLLNGYGEFPFHLVDGVDMHRGADKLIKYTSGKTGTNKWGVEVRIDKSGIVLDAPKYGAHNMTVPEGGCVLSGHNLAGSWMLENIKKGYSVAFEDGGVTVIPTGKGYIAGTNIHRAADTLILYKGKASTGTNIWGKEIACDKNGKVTKVMPWGKGNTAIPSGGFVLSGHGKGTDVLNNIKVGMTVKIVNRKVIYK